MSFLKCLSCIFCDCLCCECNCLIFPKPNSFYRTNQQIRTDKFHKQIRTFEKRNGQVVPYLILSTQKSRKRQACIIFFHGNAEDIGYSSSFLEPIIEEVNVTFYAIEYPTYGSYKDTCPGRISNKIKQDSEEFYDYILLSKKIRQENIFVMGRSIGSGGATYLANRKECPALMLISPFDSIRSVSMEMVGCLGCLVKQHFDNISEIKNFEGKLFVVHGEEDEVIGVEHGKRLVAEYRKCNYETQPYTNYPERMSHNSFNMRKDIVEPISHFLKETLKE